MPTLTRPQVKTGIYTLMSLVAKGQRARLTYNNSTIITSEVVEWDLIGGHIIIVTKNSLYICEQGY